MVSVYDVLPGKNNNNMKELVKAIICHVSPNLQVTLISRMKLGG